jgi:two-component system, OmpR family, sensor histidine kinase TctE
MKAGTGPNVKGTIRRRLLKFLLPPLIVLLVAGVGLDYLTGTTPIEHAYDQALSNAALAIAAHVRTDEGGHTVPDLPAQDLEQLRNELHDRYYVVSAPDGSYLSGDRGLPFSHASTTHPGFQDATYDGQNVRVATYRVDRPGGAITVAVAETYRARDLATLRLLSSAVLIDTVQLLVTVILVLFGVTWGLKPLWRLRDDIASRETHELAPLDTDAVPGEVRPVVDELNRLIATVRETVQSKEELLANAAHQMRTPLAGMQTQLELIISSPRSLDIRADLQVVYQSTKRLAHTAHQLLALARADPSVRIRDGFSKVDLRQLLEEVVDRELDRALAKGIDLGAETSQADVMGVDWLLRELLSNLVDNAIKYAPADGQVTVRSGVRDAHPFVEVEDNGPGIPEDERARVIERFYRSAGVSEPGCGLGLAIANEVARTHGAELTIGEGEDGCGARIVVLFPRGR